MRITTIKIKADRIDYEEDWARLSDIRYARVWDKLVGYYIEISRAGTETRAVILGEPLSDKYDDGAETMVRDFRLVGYDMSAFRGKISEKLGRSGKSIEFL